MAILLDLSAGYSCCQGQASSQSLRERQDIWRHIVMLESKISSRAPQGSLSLIDNQQHLSLYAFVRDVRGIPEEVRRCRLS